MKYYAVIGKNGAVVATSWSRAQYYRDNYLVRAHVSSFPTFEDAEQYVLDEFSEELPLHYILPEKLELNQIIFAKNLRPN